MDDAQEQARVAPASPDAQGDWSPGIARVDGAARNEPARPGEQPDSGQGAGAPSRSSRKRRKNAPGNGRGKQQRAPQRTYAAVDLGTNNCRLLVARPTGNGFEVVDAFSRIVRLGEGLGHNDQLSEAAMDRAVAALRICAAKMRRRNVSRARLVATEACRSAANADEFMSRVARETGLDLDVVTPEEEARLAVLGCLPLLDTTASRALVFDIGGGSTELVWLDMTAAANGGQPRLLGWASLPVGVVTLSDRYDGHLLDEAGYRAMVAEVAALLADRPWSHDIGDELDEAIRAGEVHLLGTSGTVTTIAGIHLGLKRYDRSRVDGTWIESADVARVTRSLSEMSFDERAGVPCVGRERADLVLAGCAILEAIQTTWPCQRLRVADRGLREGILLTMMREDSSKRKRRRRRRGKRPTQQTGSGGNE